MLNSFGRNGPIGGPIPGRSLMSMNDLLLIGCSSS